MELKIHGRNLELDEVNRAYITRKINRLSRHLPGITVTTVEVTRENSRAQDRRVVAQVTVDINGTVLRGEERGPNTIAAVNSAINVMDRRVERYKGKIYKSRQRTKTGWRTSIKTLESPASPAKADLAEDAIVGTQGDVIRVKKFPLKPMAVDEAAFQMELLGHDFFLFLDGETNQANVLYKRRGGGYGLIQAEPL